MKKVALITLHGMGITAPDYVNELSQDLARRLGPAFDALHIGAVYYKGLLLANEQRVWNSLGRQVRWDGLRQFLLYGFADAAGLESAKMLHGSVYTMAQARIARELYLARQAMRHDGPVVVLAQSLGGHVMSCYFWDAQGELQGDKANVGIWQDIQQFRPEISGTQPLSDADIGFLRGSSISHVLTTGCNIPIFVAAHAVQQILPMRPNTSFKWTNYYDKDDVLGWPLAELSEQYRATVTDVPVNAGGGLFGWIARSWNPLSHLQYWRDDEVLDPLTDTLLGLINGA